MLLAVTGHPLHTRSLSMSLTLDEQHKWRARGDILDLRKTGFAPMVTSLQPAGIVHQMSLDLVIHPETLIIESLQAEQPVVAIEASKLSNGESCRDTVQNLKVLEGEILNAEFSKKLTQTFGGPRGCSHLLTLFHFMAATIPFALLQEKKAREKQAQEKQAHEKQPQENQQIASSPVQRGVGECAFRSGFSVDGFINDKKNIELAVQLSEYHLKPEALVSSPVDRLDLEHEIRLFTEVQVADMSMQKFSIAERERCRETLSSAQWHERQDWLKEFAGKPIMPGLALRSMQFCADDQDKRLLQQILLQLAPGYIQVMAALADQWLASVEAGDTGEGSKPMGGMTDSCSMWRSDGPFYRNGEGW